MIEVVNYQSRILQIKLENGFILKGQDFKSLLNGKSYNFWIEKDGKHQTIKEFNKDYLMMSFVALDCKT